MLPRSTPEAQGIASGAILQFVERCERTIDAMHSVMDLLLRQDDLLQHVLSLMTFSDNTAVNVTGTTSGTW